MSDNLIMDGFLGPVTADGGGGGGGGGVATWTGKRYFALDYDGGNDANAGFSDVSLAAAGAVAKKTLAGFLAIFPTVGAGQTFVLGIKPRAGGATYLNVDGVTPTPLVIRGIVGYNLNYSVVRGTADFTNTAAEKVQSAPQIPAGLNVAGYNITLTTPAITAVTDATPIQVTTGVAHGLATGDAVLITGVGGITSANGDYHVDVIDATNFTLRNTRAPGQTYTAGGAVKIYRVTLAGGGAPGLPAEPGLLAKRFRYSPTTTTVALQNQAACIIRNGTDTIVFAQDPTGGDPVASDIIFIEEPAVAFQSIDIQSEGARLSVVGIRSVTSSVQFTGTATKQSASTYPQAELRLSFIDVTPSTGVTAINGGNQVVADRNWDDEDDVSVNSGTGIRTPFVGFYGQEFVTFRNSCAFGTATDFNSFNNVGSIITSAACFNRSIDFTACKIKTNSFSSSNFGIGNTIGNAGSTTRRRLRMRGVTAHGGVLNLVGSDAKIYGVFVEAMAFTSGALQVNGIGNQLQVNDLIGLGSDAGPGVSFVDAAYAQAIFARNAVNSIGGSTGVEIQLSGPANTTYANLLVTNVVDNRGNDVQGTAGKYVDQCQLVTNDSGVALVVGNVVKSNGVTNVITRPQADTLANSQDVVGAMVTSPADDALGYMAAAGNVNVRMDAAPTPGATCWLSQTNASQGMTALPTDGNFDLPLGQVVTARVVGGVNYAVVSYVPPPESPIPTETLDLELMPEMTRNGAVSTRVIQTTFEGASFWVPKRVRFNRVVVNLSAYTAGAPTTIKVLIYQAPQGTSGASATAARQAALIAAVSADPGATGNFEGAVTEAVLEEGLCYVLYGRASAGGSATIRVYAISTNQLENTVVPTNTHPLVFNTAVAASGANPATIDTRDTVTLTATATEVVPIVRLKRV